MKRIVIALSILFLALSSYGQGRVDEIRELYQNDMYEAVRREVSILMNADDIELPELVKSELESYSVLSAIKMGHKNVDGLVNEFRRKYPFSPQLSRVIFHQSIYYFDKEEYAESITLLESVDNKYLGEDEGWRYMFNKAYCNMRIGNNDKAAAGFRQILSLDYTPYHSASTYYLGYLSYISKDFTESVEYFKKLEDNHEYSLLSRYFICESYFMLENYKDAIRYGEGVYEELDGDFKLKCMRILSQSYFELDNTRDAKRYLEMYSEHSENLSRKDNYYSGVVSYSLQAYYAAIDAFSKVVAQKDSLAQNGYLYLGNSYLKIKNKLGALDAFKKASELDFNATIQEEAMFLYAKLAFDLNSDIVPFNNYISKYPSSQKGDEIYNYIATSYLQKKNYKEAIVALEKVKYLTPEMMLNLQKASFFRAMQLLEMDSYRSAIEYFQISLKNGLYNQPLSYLAKFWMGEAYFRINDYPATIGLTEPLIQNPAFVGTHEYPMALVNMGYSHFNMEAYPAAKMWFEEYLKLSPSLRNMTLEVRTRLADCYYMEGDYERAAEIYEEVALKTFDQDDIYATYMGALSYGLIPEPRKKISMLRNIIEVKPNSDYYHKAVYELGRSYVQAEDNDEAIECFNMLLEDKRDSTYYTKSLLELGMIHSNISKYDEALGYFKTIVEKYPLSDDVTSALAGMESVYQILNRPEDYLAYLDALGMSSIKSADEKEEMLFNAAEQLFLSGKYSEALASLGSFIEKYPAGAKTTQAHFYMAESYNKTGKPEFAADEYLKVMDTGDGAFVELATLYYGQIELKLEHFDKAAYAFETLGSIAQLENNKYEALLGKMRAYYGGGRYDKAISAGEGVLKSEKADADIRREANYTIAKSYQLQGNREASFPIFTTLAADYSNPMGAESAYILVLSAYDEGDFEKVENLVYAFSEAESSQTYWLAKSFIVLGDSFAERDEWEQAKATFQSIKEGYTPENGQDDVLEQVEMRLSKIEENE